MENTRPDIIIHHLNEVECKIQASQGILYEISDFFTFNVANAHFMKHKRKGLQNWDGKIRLFNTFNKKLLMGLVPTMVDFAKSNGYVVENRLPVEKYSIDETWFKNIIKQLPHEIRDYQESSVHEMIKRQRSILLSPTGSGKSLMIYLLTRWALDNIKGKVLIIVPTVSLVHQMAGDFAEYSKHMKWDANSHIQTISGGSSKEFKGDIIISTWQSIYKLPEHHFKLVTSVVGDEAHLYKAKSLDTILKKCTNAKIRCGTTGTLDNIQINKLILQGIFGPAFKVASTKELQDLDYLSRLDIKLIRLKYPDNESSGICKLDYQDEVNHVVGDKRRNQFITNLARALPGNTLILFNLVDKHGKVLHEMLKASYDGPVYFVHGQVKASDREDIRHLVETQDNAVVLASFGTFSTGVNIKRINNLILAGSTKSKIRTLQSIGRGLRLSEYKSGCNLYDICDDYTKGKNQNYLFKHSLERLQYYYEEGFPVKTKSYTFEGLKVLPYKKQK